MIGHVASDETLNEPIGEKALGYKYIIATLIDKLECGILCLKNVPIIHNGGRHCILVCDLSLDSALVARINSVVEKFNRMKDIEITISRADIAKNERFKYSYIVVVQKGKVKAELP